MRLLILALVVSVLLAWGGSVPDAPPITIYTSFQHDPTVPVEKAFEEELASIMEPVGRQVEWRSLDAPNERRVAAEIVVVTFLGRCDARSMLLGNSESVGLGWTHLSDGEILPFAEVDCDRLQALVQNELFRLRPEDRAEAFGRAMARVTAHELFHILARTMQHGSGLSKRAYSSHELLAEELAFDGRETMALRKPVKAERARKAPAAGKPGVRMTFR